MSRPRAVEGSSTASKPDFEALLKRISSMMVDVPADQVDPRIDETLAMLGAHMGVDRAFVDEFSKDRKSFRVTHMWTAEGIPAEDWIWDVNLVEQVPWYAARMLSGEHLVFESLEELPAEAGPATAYARETGIQSSAIVPLSIGGDVIGNLGFDCIRSPRSWSSELVRRLGLAADLVASALARREAQIELQRRLDFEGFVSRLSATFINLAGSEVDGRIEAGLRALGEFLVVGRASLLRFESQPRRLRVTHMWRSEGIPRDREVDGRSVEGRFPWLVEELTSNRSVSIETLESFPPEARAEREYCEREGIQSTLLVPVALEGEPAAAVALDAMRAPATWPSELVRRLRLVGEIFVNALARKDADDRVQMSLRSIEELKDRLRTENVYLREEIAGAQAFDEIVGDSPALTAVLNRIRHVASTDATVLITGETGVGKELVARAVHNQSRRKARALVKVNCGALPASLVESELFGHEKGAFTGATSKRVGRFELADGATILLDEVSELPLELQTRLLRVLQEGQFEPVGSSKTRRVDVRVIAASNRDLEMAVDAGLFRSDLYYRLNVFPIHVPPLRDRRSDIPLLVWHFIAKHRRRLGRVINSVPDSVMESLMAYGWPGNVRELENTIERAIIVTAGTELSLDAAGQGRGEIQVGAVPTPQAADETIDELQRAHIQRVLADADWKIKGRGNAAERLGLSPSLLRHRMKKLRIERPAKG
jgi:transcriptional regulator with GAF, ATPase, and Fis domain